MQSETITNTTPLSAADQAATPTSDAARAPRTRTEINRANAQKSTGPRTEDGKNRARFNAVRHGLSGRTVLLPSDDLIAYKDFSEKIARSLRPETDMEIQLAQTVADTYWRLNRARGWEDGMLALGDLEHAGDIDIDSDDPQLLTALTSAAAFRQHNQAFANLTIYEQRLERLAARTLKQLQDLQTERKRESAERMNNAVVLHRAHEVLKEQWDPAEDGFVYSRAQIQAESDRRARLTDARTALIERYDPTKSGTAMAA